MFTSTRTNTTLFSILLLTHSGVVAQANDVGTAPDRGYVISVETPQGIPQKSGSPAKFSGNIQLSGRKYDHYKGHDRKTLLEMMRDDGVSVQIFFPDFTNPVTPSVSLSSTKKEVSFQYTTPNLNAVDLNTLIIQVSKVSDQMQSLLRIQSKLQKRIAALNDLISSLSKKHHPESIISEIRKLRDRLAVITAKIDQRSSQEPMILAENRFPLQINNLVTQPSLNSTVMGKYKIILEFDIGSAIDGEKTKAHATITNLRKQGDDSRNSNDDGDDKKLAQFYWNNSLVKEMIQALPGGSTISFNYDTPKLFAANQNVFSATLSNKGDGRDWDHDYDDDGKLLARLSLKEPVAQDLVAPIWLAGSTPDLNHAFVKSVQSISATVQDMFGLIDPQGFKA
ncbi:MAG: hypothetical protein AABZ55_13510, partial [Bdellovibrionota bacterium]